MNSIQRGNLYQEAENISFELREFQPAYVLSLLRTREYIEFENAKGSEQEFQDRLARQSILKNPLKHFAMVMTEGALRWAVGSPEVMIRQIDHILTVSRQQNVHLGIIPWNRPVNFFIGHAFHIYGNEQVIVGTKLDVIVFKTKKQIDEYVNLFSELVAIADFDQQSENTLLRIRKSYEALV